MGVGHLLSHINYFSLFHKIMDENQLNRALANLTDDNEAWMAIEHLLNESSKHATLVALDVALKAKTGFGNAATHRPSETFTAHSIREGRGVSPPCRCG